MLHRIFGQVGSGKKERLLGAVSAAYEAGKRIYVLVPEQATAGYERDVIRRLGNRAGERVEVTNFSRLPDLVLRAFGGLGEVSLSDTEKKILFFSCMKELAAQFTHLQYSLDADAVDALFAELEEMRLAGLDAEEMLTLSESGKVPRDTALLLSDLALLRNRYREKTASYGAAAESEEMRLASVLSDEPFFRDCAVFVDGFWDFTAPQEKLLREILRQAESVTVTFAALPNQPLLFEKALRAAQKLKKIATELKRSVTDEILPTKKDTEISFLKSSLVGDGSVWEKTPATISLTAAESPLEEALMVADQIHALVRSGASYREILVLHREENALSVPKLCLEEEGIPVFSEERSALSSSPLARTVLLAVKIARNKARAEEVRAFVKKGVFLCGEEERFLLDEYLSTWSLSCYQVLKEAPFTMNPDGYHNKTRENEWELEKVNRARETVFAPVRSLAQGLKAASVREKTEAILVFLRTVGADELTKQTAEKEKARGDFSAAAERSRVWNSLISALAETERMVGEKEESAEDFFHLLTLAFSRSLPGEIPPGQDRVQIAPLGFTRPDACRYVFLMGMTSGVFPAAKKAAGVLKNREKELITALGYPLSTDESSVREEYFLFHQAAGFATDGLFLSFVSSAADGEKKHDLSIFGKRVQALFPALPLTVYRSEKALPPSAERGFSYAARLSGNSDEGKKWKRYFLENPLFVSRSLAVEAAKAFSEKPFRLEENLPYPNCDAKMSYSRLEKYSNCPFSFFSRYLLEAKVRGKASIAANVVGNFTHSVLEKVMVELSLRGVEIRDASAELLKELNETACRQAVREELGDDLGEAAESFVRRMTENTLTQLKLLKKEFSASRFRPIFFEKDLDDLDGTYAIDLKDGTKLVLGGKIDRVDLYESRDGKPYVRVVDYKTGGHAFSLDDVANGISIQMLLYLFALCRQGFSLGEAEVLPLPAGILYLNGTVKTALCHDRAEIAHREERPFADFSVEGLLVKNEELLAAQDPDGNGEFLPVKRKKDGSYSGASSLIAAEKLGVLSRRVEKIFASLAESLKEGKIGAVPLSHGKDKNVCTYCDYLPICKTGTKNPRPYRRKIGDSLVEEKGGEEA